MASRLGIRTYAREAMEYLQQRTRETVHLCVLDGDEVVYVHKIDSPEPVRAFSEVGARSPAWCVAPGKAILAWQPQAYLAGLSERLQRFTPRTITEPAEFLRELERARGNGYAVNRGEYRETVWGVAAPIRSGDGVVVASIGISGPATRVKPALFKELGAEVMLAAGRVGRNLGAHG
jgi:DNA-binding IclR family transcriptional regulator